jgi:DNA excision repair protein ERCC-8
MWKEIRHREEGSLGPIAFSRRFFSRRVAALDLSNRKEFVSLHRGAINSLQVDLTEGRYLLSGASDGCAAVFDTQQATNYEGGGLIAKHHSLFHLNAHKYGISSAVWYPIDTGLFITASLDHYVKLWDTNSTQVFLSHQFFFFYFCLFYNFSYFSIHLHSV